MQPPMRAPLAAMLGLLALQCFLQPGGAQDDAVRMAWAPSQKCDDSPGGNCAVCNEVALQCLICLPGYGFNSQGACQECRMGNLRLCLTCNLQSKPPKCLKCLGVPTSDTPYSWGNPGFPVYMNPQGQCQRCIKVDNIGCLTCDRTGSRCTMCNDGFVLEGGTCKQCLGENCKKCHTNGECYECVENKRGPSYGPTTMKTCNQCKSVGCVRCDKDWHKCQRCMDGIASIGEHGYGSDGKGNCVPCKSPLCAKCQRDYRNCTECASDPASIAPPHMTPTGECKRCLIAGCEACSASGKTCSKCIDGYAHTPSGQCQKLPHNCRVRNCHDCRDDRNTCRACNPQFYLHSSKKCKRCANGCAVCYTGKDDCKKCNPNTGLVNGVCVRCDTKNAEYSWCEQCNGNIKRCQKCWPADKFRPDPRTGGCVRYRLPDTIWS